jgi:DNA-binding Lrp family transcriptional regulator
MVHAYVMVVTASGTSQDVLPEIRALEGVTQAHVVDGEYDIVAEFDVPDTGDLLSRVTSEVQHLDGVDSTRTYIALD